MNTVEYLEALPLRQESRFILATNPRPRRFSEDASRQFHRVVADVFPNVSFGTYSSRCECQERLYLVKDFRSDMAHVHA